MSPATLPGPGIDVEVCLGIGSIDPAGVWDSGTWNYNVWTQPDTSLGDWDDITCQVATPLTMGAGSSPDGVVTRWEAATCAFTLLGDLWDPRSGPYTGLLGPALPVRVRWRPTGATAWTTCFLGQTTDDGFAYDPKTATATVAATDGTAILAAYDGVEQPSQGAGETAAQRVTRIADMAGWPSSRRDITPGGVAVQATTLADAAWTLLLAVADTDLALLWINRNGDLAYRPEGKVKPSHQLAAVIGCTPTPTVPANLLDAESAGFETGTIGHWSPYQRCAVANAVAQAHGGVHSLAVTTTVDLTGVESGPYLSLPGVQAGTSYHLAAYAFAAVAAHLNVYVWWFDAGSNYLGGPYFPAALVPGAWTQVGGDMVAPAGAVSLQLVAQFSGAGIPAGTVFYLDDIAVVDLTPSPPGPDYVDPVNIVGQQPTVTRNVVSVSRQARDDTDTPVTVTVTDQASVSRFLAHGYQRTDLIHNDDAWSTTVADAILLSSAWPSTAPASVDLSSRVDPAAAALLLTLEPSLSVQVTDGVGAWECEPAGWQITLAPEEVSGTVELLDVSAWYGSTWDADYWDRGRWGF